METPESDELLTGLTAGNVAAFAALYDRWGTRLFQVAVGLLRCREDAEDAVQEAFLGLVRSRNRLNDVRDLEAYLFASLRRAASRGAVRRSRWPVSSESAVQGAAAPAEWNRLSGLEASYLDALQKLPREQREVATLKIDGGLTFEQIGIVMETSSNTAASRYRYALEKLRQLLDDERR